MNHDDNKTDLRPLIETDLEARVVAWVSGEASAFEVAELERLIGEKPELAIFKRRIEAVRGLVAEAIRPDSQPLLLSPERRAKLLQAIGASAPAAVASVDRPIVAAKRKHRSSVRWMYGVAACLVAGLATMMMIPAFQNVRSLEAKHYPPAAAPREPRMEEARTEAHAFAVAQENRRQRSAAGGHLEVESTDAVATPGEGPQVLWRSAAPIGRNQSSAFELKQGAGDKRASASQIAESQAIALGSVVSAQAPASAPMISFESRSESSTGYTAAAKLAGNRLNTELKDVGSSVSVSTRQFLGDIKAKNAEGFRYAGTGTELVGGAGSYSINSRATGDTSVALDAPPVRLFGFDSNRSLGGAPVGLKEEALSLSPFEVNFDGAKGYAAGSTLGGTRLEKSIASDELKKSDDSRDAEDKPLPARPKPAQAAFPEVSAAKEPVSTFSLHVSDVSFRLAQAALARNQSLERERLRPEEFYNAFDYGDPNPALAEKVSARIEQAAHPFLQQRNLVRVAVKVAASGRDAAQPLRLTVLLDTSGSMEREDRVATVQRAMASLNSLLGPSDRLTLIGFARQPRLLAEALPGDQAGQVLDLMAQTPAEGGTNLEEALKLGHELARRQFEPAAQNRVVLLTDGAANLGNAQPAQLAAAVEALRREGIAFDACGVGLEGLDDAMLETLTRQGDGRYYVLNSPEAADANFSQQLAGAFRPAAENVKLQVRFNPNRVGQYRLIGFEQHRLREEDFRNDQVDAAELAAEEAAVAVYQVETLPQGEGELGEVYVRFRDAATGNMVERSWPMGYDAQAPAFDRASPSMQLAGSAALFAEMLRGGEAEAAGGLGDLAPFMNRLRNRYANEPRVQELVTMYEQARRQAGK